MRVWRIHDPAALGAETVFWTRSRNSPPDSDEYIVAVPKVRSSKYAIVGIYVPCATSRKVPGGGFRVRARRVRKCAVPWTPTLRRVLSGNDCIEECPRAACRPRGGSIGTAGRRGGYRTFR